MNGVHLQRKYENQQVYYTEEKCNKISFCYFPPKISNKSVCACIHVCLWMALFGASLAEQFVVYCKTWNLELHTAITLLCYCGLTWSGQTTISQNFSITFIYKESIQLWFHVLLKLRWSLILPIVCHQHILSLVSVPCLTWQFTFYKLLLHVFLFILWKNKLLWLEIGKKKNLRNLEST